MPALVAGSHVFVGAKRKAWMAGSSPAMTISKYHDPGSDFARLDDACRLT